MTISIIVTFIIGIFYLIPLAISMSIVFIIRKDKKMIPSKEDLFLLLWLSLVPIINLFFAQFTLKEYAIYKNRSLLV
ncbi:hypothetical protein [Alishewanella phage vB_AspM_Slickus01]|nr:hypothetical protein [Alishewanella phage vB_AspM_Slickus01]